ncbi:hypothetical protein ACLMJK_002333 [Lecanora helva]
MRLSRYLKHLCPTIQAGTDCACVFAFILTFGLTLYRHFWLERYDPLKCNASLEGGRWLDSNYEIWQPPGCMMHHFHQQDLLACFKDRKLLFIGDSTVRQSFYATAEKLGIIEQGEEVPGKHADLELDGDDGLTLNFVWDPYLNSSFLHRELTAAIVPPDKFGVAGTTALLLIGGGLWHARYLEDYFVSFQDSFERISQTVVSQDERQLDKRSTRFTFGNRNIDNLIALAPVPVPAYGSLSSPRADTITPDKVNAMNKYLRQMADELPLPVAWSFNSMTTEPETTSPSAFQSDGLHINSAIVHNMLDVLLSMRCNMVLRESRIKAYPMDKTCCSSYKSPSSIQALILNMSTGVLPLLVLATFGASKAIAMLPSRKITHAIATLAFAICYCYYADRTHLFNKVHKHYHYGETQMVYAIAALLGMSSIRRSGTAVERGSGMLQSQEPDRPFLSRDQTDEWKGWMQIIILIYHYTGASKILWVYQIVRLLVASYLFMSGFGHTIFFSKKADYSLRRGAAVLIRLNMLSCILPYLMETDYMFYYFAPLISFWYVVVYCTMIIGRKSNHSITFMLSKIVISAISVNLMIRRTGTFETLFYFLRRSCKIEWNQAEWLFRLKLDSCIVYIGMLCAVISIRITDALGNDTIPKTNFDRFVRKYFNRLCTCSVVLAISMCSGFFVLAGMSSSKQEYNSWFPYVSFIPVLSFVILRNSTRCARNHHSSIFAWVGRHSLETFTLQYHIWLAADTKGLLAIGILEKMSEDKINGRRFDMVALTIIFFWVCWHVAAATQTLTTWLVHPRDERKKDGGEEYSDGEDNILPTMKLEESTRQNGRDVILFKKIFFIAMEVATRTKTLVADHLEVRLVLIVMVMWLLNMLSA